MFCEYKVFLINFIFTLIINEFNLVNCQTKPFTDSTLQSKATVYAVQRSPSILSWFILGVVLALIALGTILLWKEGLKKSGPRKMTSSEHLLREIPMVTPAKLVRKEMTIESSRDTKKKSHRKKKKKNEAS